MKKIKRFNNILDTAEEKINEMENKSEQNIQAKAGRYKMDEKY